MEFFKIKRDIPFMDWGIATTTISLVTFILAIFFLATRGLNFGIDFTGGTLMEVTYKNSADVNRVRKVLEGLNLGDATVQNFGTATDVLIRLPLKKGVTTSKLSEQVTEALKRDDAGAQVRRVEFVGPQVGKELASQAALALLFVSLGIIVYLSIRFKWRPAVATVLANLHDIVIILGFFAFFQWEFSLPVLAAVLAILGYSVNESVVVFDRVRENFRKMRNAGIKEVINNAITRTLSRTIITHGSTQLAVTAMLFFGGTALHYFALALTIGILFGIYSSALVACPVAMWLGMSREDFVAVKKETTTATTPDAPRQNIKIS